MVGGAGAWDGWGKWWAHPMTARWAELFSCLLALAVKVPFVENDPSTLTKQV